MRLPLLPLSLALFAPAAAAQPNSEPVPPAAAPPEASEGEASAPQRVFIAAEQREGFTAGLRLGVGVPYGNAGRDTAGGDRELSDLTTVRVPVWVDVGYSFGALTLGIYGQVGVGVSGDACIGDCDWSDVRVGAQGELRFAPGAPVDPWLGVGLGVESLSYRTLAESAVVDPSTSQPLTVRATERFVGPELLLHAGVDFQVEDALRFGPFAALSVGQYVADSYNCTPDSPLCRGGSSVDGGALHGWISVGLRGAYTP
ncbi:MAG TPA: hypothetical protein VNN80_07490 [Polyangiaceae bacterium]|jgi:hypothetical protein|nr:hypothetical protein [Polyangiaceae bacterium]